LIVLVVNEQIGMEKKSRRSSGRAAVTVEERFNICDVKSVFPAAADAVSLENPDLAPESDGIGMNVQQMSYLGYPE
jgi:hypothetical protein